MKALYFDCFSGVCGNMVLGALLDLGADQRAWMDQLKTLPLGGWTLGVRRVEVNGIGANAVRVTLDEPHGQGHSHDHPHDHSHDHPHDHSHGHEHRGYLDILALIDASGITDNAKRIAGGIYRRIAQAEARVHGRPLDAVRFHEVGATDSVIDIVGTAVLVDMLGVERVFCSVVSDGFGFTRCQHGVIPVPAPAVAEIFSDPKARFRQIRVERELVTPTGAAIVTELSESFGDMPPLRGAKVGYGAGTRKLPIPGVLRVFMGELFDPTGRGE